METTFPLGAGGGSNLKEQVGRIPPGHEVFDHFPHGVLVFDRSGRLVAANKAAARFLGPLRRTPDGRPPRCCDLFGCNAGGVLGGVCLAELAAGGDAPLPEIRIDLGADAPADAVWLTVAPFNGHHPQFLVEIRSADSHDRRRRTQPNWMGERRLDVHALGRTRLESREGPLEGAWLEQRAGQVLKYLICERRRVVYPGELAGAIWPHDDAPETGTVRYFVHRLRRHLEPLPPAHGPSSFVIASEGGYRLSPSVRVDADDFEHHVRIGFDARSEGRGESAQEHLEQAMALYRGDLIADQPNAAWAFDERERLRALADAALRHLLRVDLDREDLMSALERLRRLVQLEPFDLELHRWLLTTCLACGRRSEALRRFKVLKAGLREQFSEELDFELADLGSPDALRAVDPEAVPDVALPGASDLGERV